MSRPESDTAKILQLLRRTARRRNALWVLSVTTASIAFSLILATLLITYHRLLSPAWRLELPLAATILGVPLLVACAAYLFRCLKSANRLEVALALERRCAIKERISSALFVRELDIAPEAARALLQDAEDHASRVHVAAALPVERPRAFWPAVAMLAICTGTFLLVPALDLRGAARAREREEVAAKRVAEHRERLRAELKRVAEQAQQEPIDLDTKRILERLAERERRDAAPSDGRVERRAALVESEEMLRRLEDRRGRPDLARLDEVMAKIAKESGSELQTAEAQSAVQAMRDGDPERAAEALARLSKKLEAAQKGEAPAQSLAALQSDLAALAKKLGDLPAMQEMLRKLDQKGVAADLARLSPEDLAKLSELSRDQLAQLARLLRARDLLDRALGEIKLSQEELAALPAEWPELCEDCKNGRPCAAAEGGGG